MSQMTPAQARIVDPLVTELALAYKPSQYVAHHLFPRINVPARAGKIPNFDNDDQRLVDSTHTPGANVPEVTVSWNSENFGLVDRVLHGKVPLELLEEGLAVPGIDMKAYALRRVQRMIALDLENTSAQLARNAARYDAQHKITLAGATRWSQTTGTPALDIQVGRKAVRNSIGVEPNVLVISDSTFTILANNVGIKEQFKYTTPESLTVDMLARYFQLPKVVVASSTYLSDATNLAVDIWGNDSILAYVPTQGNYLEPSYGYTLALRGYPFANPAYWDGDTESWKVPWREVAQPYMTSMASGYLFVNSGT